MANGKKNFNIDNLALLITLEMKRIQHPTPSRSLLQVCHLHSLFILHIYYHKFNAYR